MQEGLTTNCKERVYMAVSKEKTQDISNKSDVKIKLVQKFKYLGNVLREMENMTLKAH